MATGCANKPQGEQETKGGGVVVGAKILIKALLRFLTACGLGQHTNLSLRALTESSLLGGALVLSSEWPLQHSPSSFQLSEIILVQL
jgi:hypothetical protein